MSLWDSWGERHAVTVCQIDRCIVLQQKTLSSHGYEACVLGLGNDTVAAIAGGLAGAAAGSLLVVEVLSPHGVCYCVCLCVFVVLYAFEFVYYWVSFRIDSFLIESSCYELFASPLVSSLLMFFSVRRSR